TEDRPPRDAAVPTTVDVVDGQERDRVSGYAVVPVGLVTDVRSLTDPDFDVGSRSFGFQEFLNPIQGEDRSSRSQAVVGIGAGGGHVHLERGVSVGQGSPDDSNCAPEDQVQYQ